MKQETIYYTTQPDPNSGKTHQNRILLFSPTTPSSPSQRSQRPPPLLIWFHGGGGCTGSPEASTTFCQTLCLNHRLTIAAPYYRLSPEHNFETSYKDAWAALSHLSSAKPPFPLSSRVNLSPDQAGGGLLVGGVSFGATISSILALQARDAPLPNPINGIFLSAGSFVPKTLADKVLTPDQRALYLSHTQPECVGAPLLPQKLSTCLALARRDDETSPYSRPLNWPVGEKGFTGMPRSYFQACGRDITRDDTLVYEEILRSAGAETKLNIYPGCPHLFWELFMQTKAAQAWRRDTAEAIRWLLGSPVV